MKKRAVEKVLGDGVLPPEERRFLRGQEGSTGRTMLCNRVPGSARFLGQRASAETRELCAQTFFLSLIIVLCLNSLSLVLLAFPFGVYKKL